MSSIIAIIKALLLLADLVKLIKGEITTAVFNAKIKEIQDNAKKASSGPLEDRLNAGKKIEDHINDHTP